MALTSQQKSKTTNQPRRDTTQEETDEDVQSQVFFLLHEGNERFVLMGGARLVG